MADSDVLGDVMIQMVYLWGSGDAYDTTVMALRRKFGESLSMKAAYAEAFRSAGRSARSTMVVCSTLECAVQNLFHHFQMSVWSARGTNSFSAFSDVCFIMIDSCIQYFVNQEPGGRLANAFRSAALCAVSAHFGCLVCWLVGWWFRPRPQQSR